MIDLDPFSILVTILYVGLLYVFLSKFFFGPVTRILEERRAAIEGRLEQAENRIAEVEKKTAEYEAAIREARSEGYRNQETIRGGALEDKARLLAEAREEAEKLIDEARARLAAETADAKKRLESEIDALAARLSETLLPDQSG